MARVTSRLSRSTLLKIMVTVFIVVLIDDIPFFYRWLTDDGHGIYLPPDDVDPPPRLERPWPPIAPPEGPLPRLSRSDIPTYFFPVDAQSDENGLRTRKLINGPLLIHVSEPGEGELDDVVRAVYRDIRAVVPRLPEAFTLPEIVGTDLPAQISAYVNRKALKADHRGFVWRGKGPIGERMEEIGCHARPSFWYSGGAERDSLPPEDAFTVNQAFIATWHNVGEPTVDHCLFKALLVALGLHPTEGFFFKEGPVTPEEQARALAALALLYHPAVKPGMTEDEFVAVLLENDLIDP